MNPLERLLHFQRADLRVEALQDSIEHLKRQLGADATELDLEQALAAAIAERQRLEAEVGRLDAATQDRSRRLHARRAELMSGRLSHPAELMRLAHEVQNLEQTLAAEEDRELELIAAAEAAEEDEARSRRRLEAHRQEAGAAAAKARARLAEEEPRLTQARAERERDWQAVPDDLRAIYQRLKAKRRDPVAEVAHGTCQACHVAITSGTLQAVRRAETVQCDNCERILVMA